MEFFATCPKGFERLLSAELASLGLSQVRPLGGQVTFSGDLEDAYRACLWSRLASRVALVLARVDARDSDALYEGIAAIPWEDHVPMDATIAIDAHGTNAELRNTQFIALRAKDAVSDRMLSRRGVRPMTDTSDPDLRLVCRVRNDRATVGIDLTGEALFRRGYESGRGSRNQTIAPMRPDYAAALLDSGAWFRNCRHDSPSLLVGFAGAGTLVAEAAAQALDRAPGLLRRRWGFQGWLGHDADVWDRLMAEAGDRAEAAADRDLSIVATDVRDGWQTALRQTLRAAGIDVEPTLVNLTGTAATAGAAALAGAVADMPTTPLAICDCSFVLADDLAGCAQALAGIAAVGDALPSEAGLVALSLDATADAALRCDPTSLVDVIAGSEPATIRTYDLSRREGEGASVSLPGGATIPVLVPSSDQFAARLAKVAKRRAKWARREGVTCYRVYDADLPDYAVAIDLYEGLPGVSRRTGKPLAPRRWVVVAEYAAPREVDPALARERLLDVLAIVPPVLGAAPSDTFVRVRTRSRGGSQYSDGGRATEGGGRDERRRPRMHLVEEGGLEFSVNFEDYLDTGIFLDHRDTRAMVRELAKKVPEGGSFCNLFAYTGTASCYAADGGVGRTVTVDMSRTYLDWAQRNMERNGFDGPGHRFVQDDVLQWVEDERHSPHRYDLVFCDPPTFSNSSRMRKRAWDVQRDHAELLISISRMLAAGGVCVFSCNLRNFKPDVEALAKAGVEIEDITEKTIPEDFQRNKKIHHCYLVRRTPRPEGEPERAAVRQPSRTSSRDFGRGDGRPGGFRGPDRRDGRDGFRGGRGGDDRGPRGNGGGRPFGADRRDERGGGRDGRGGAYSSDRPRTGGYGSDRPSSGGYSRGAGTGGYSGPRDGGNGYAGPRSGGPRGGRPSNRGYGGGYHGPRNDRPGGGNRDRW